MPDSMLPPLKLIFETAVTSTQDAIVPIIKENPDKCVFLLAETQTAGRGRRDHDWVSLPGGLWGTFAFPIPQVPTSEQLIFLHYQVALILRNLLKQHYSLQVLVKWPNDIIYLTPKMTENSETGPQTPKKVAGILIEMLSSPAEQYILVGLGINLNNAANDFPIGLMTEVISVTDILHRNVHLPKFARALGLSLRKTLSALFALPPTPETISQIMREYM
ncbi:MAG: biotin--[acetyl-CoA-carboxylase] ligase [Promethearchaeota archaeon]|nr:MAG: biotin--[acetyl-CoA-carboxylase] ligase [Candidatus Lokiarchaeota archaeon]